MRINSVSNYPVPYWNRSINKNERLKSFRASEFKYGSERITLDEISTIKSKNTLSLGKVKCSPKEKLTKEKWLDKLFDNKTLYGKTITDMELFDFTPNEAKDIIDESIYHCERATDWAISNEHFAGIASNSALISALLGVVNGTLNIFDENDSLVPSSVKHTLGVIESGTAALRGYIQYEKVYGGRSDDDRARNKYESKEYGNKIAGLFSDLAYIFETNINPVGLVALNLLNNDLNHNIRPLLSLCNSLWWRVRMLAEIDQQFGTDLFTYLINKPGALLGIESAIKKVKEIKDSGYFNYEYIQDRLIELIGLNPEKNKLTDTFPELGRLLKDILSNDKHKAAHSSHTLGKFLGPILGFYGFIAYGIGVPIKSILHWLNIESKWINFFSKSGGASQQILYLFRMFIPEQYKNISEEINESDKKAVALRAERTKLFHAGVTVCSTNILATLLQLKNTEESSSLVKAGKRITEEIAEKGINYFFSQRRYLLGKKFRFDNPELYNPDGTAKFISDKVKIEDVKNC